MLKGQINGPGACRLAGQKIADRLNAYAGNISYLYHKLGNRIGQDNLLLTHLFKRGTFAAGLILDSMNKWCDVTRPIGGN